MVPHLGLADAHGQRSRAQAPALRARLHRKVIQVPVGAQQLAEQLLLLLLARVRPQQPVSHPCTKSERQRQQPLPHHLPWLQLPAAQPCMPAQSLGQSLDYTLSSHLGLIRCVTLVATVGTQHHIQTSTGTPEDIHKIILPKHRICGMIMAKPFACASHAACAQE